MPCRDDIGFMEDQARREYVRKSEENEKKGILPPAVLLCSACRSLERMGYDFEENPALSIWWDNHKKEDASRECNS